MAALRLAFQKTNLYSPTNSSSSSFLGLPLPNPSNSALQFKPSRGMRLRGKTSTRWKTSNRWGLGSGHGRCSMRCGASSPGSGRSPGRAPRTTRCCSSEDLCASSPSLRLRILPFGATSRIGRILVRKLMPRGYNVKALVRKTDIEVLEMLPRSVNVVVGDAGEPSTLKSAVEGCNKIIYCATARSAITGDLNRVDYQGVINVSKAFQDYNNQLAQLRAGKSSKSKMLLAKFKSPDSLNSWEVRKGTYFQDVVATKYDGGMDTKFEFMETGEAVFSGYVFTRGGYVELSKRLSLPLGSTLDRYDGLLLSVRGNGRSYVLILEAGPLADTSQSKLYFTRIITKIRVPFSSFRSVKPDDPPLDPFLVHTLTIRFEPRRQRPVGGITWG